MYSSPPWLQYVSRETPPICTASPPSVSCVVESTMVRGSNTNGVDTPPGTVLLSQGNGLQNPERKLRKLTL